MKDTLFADFDTAARAVLSFLYRRMGFGLWMVTRTEGDDWIVLQAEDHGYDVKEGTVFRWADSFCSRMVDGLGPRIAPSSDAVPAYASAPIGQQVKIGAYVGVPLRGPEGALFGTLCAIDPQMQPAAIVHEQELVEMMAGLLSSLLQAELRLVNEARRAERAESEALTDGLTGLYNRRGWVKLLAAEEGRCRRYGHPASIIAIDLDGLKAINDIYGHLKGDELLARAGSVIRGTARSQDVVARVGGDEFVVLTVECDRAGSERQAERLRAGFAQAGVKASIGLATRRPERGLQHSWEDADSAMYADKRSSSRVPRTDDHVV